MYKVVKATVGAIITRREDGVEKILLTRRAIQPFQDHWCLPGGHIDAFEPAREAVIREVKEETGLEFTPAFFGYFDEIIPALDWHAVVLVFTGGATGEPRIDPEEVAEIQWLSLAEAQTRPLAFQHNAILAAYSANAGGKPV